NRCCGSGRFNPGASGYPLTIREATALRRPAWQDTRLGRLAEIRSTSGDLYAGSSSSKMSSHLRPRANSEATNRKSPDHASRTIVWHLCPQVLSPFANANRSEVDPEVAL